MSEHKNALRRSSVWSAVTAIAITLGTVHGPARAADFNMVIPYLHPEDLTNNEVHPALVHFASIVESATDGKIDVELFGGGQLGSEVENGKEAQLGRTVQSTVMSSGAMSSFLKEYQIVTTPFLFPNYQVARAYFDGAWHANFMRRTIKSAGLRYLGTMDDGGGFVAFTNNKRLVRTVADIKGLRIRVEENPAHVATMKALGASATPLPWGEVITALSTGLADGQFNAPGVSLAFKLWEVNNFTTWSGHVYNSISWMMSEKWYQSLPDNYKRIVIQSAREATQMAHGFATLAAVQGWAASCKRFKKCHLLSADEKKKMASVARPAWKKWITEDYGVEAALVDGLWAEVDQIERDLAVADMKRYGN